MIIFTFDNNQIYAGDYWSTGHTAPRLDTSYYDGSNDVTILEQEISGQQKTIKIRRLLDT